MSTKKDYVIKEISREDFDQIRTEDKDENTLYLITEGTAVNYEKFARWVADEIFDEMWEYNKDAFAELACRKLYKLGIVGINQDNEWVYTEENK